MTISVYPEYKVSGVPWLGHVPEHWEVKALKYVASCNDESVSETTPPDFELQYVDIASVDSIRGITAYECLTFENAPSRARRIARNGDTIVSTVRTYLKAITPIVDPPPNLVVSTGFAVIRPKNEVFSGYLSYLLRCEGFVSEIMAYSVGISYPAINPSDLMRLRVSIPPLEEQRAIASFLDRKTAQIDELIAKKEALLKKLDEKRTALITHAVTKGLDPSVPMKDSGVEWIGKIPMHWEVKRLKYIASCNDESLAENTDTQYEIKYIDISSINLSAGITHKETLSFEKAPSRARRIVRHGDTIVSTVRTYLKAIAPIIDPEENLIVSTGFAVIRPKKHYSSCFLGYFLQTEGFVGQVVANSVGVSYPAINANELLQISVIVPPLEEQQAIALQIERKTATIDCQKAQVTEAIEPLKEYRSALITDAVIGKMTLL